MFIIYLHPLLLTIFLYVDTLFLSEPILKVPIIPVILITPFLLELQYKYKEFESDTRECFPYIKPLETFRLIGSFLKWFYGIVMIPVKKTASFTVKVLEFIFKQLSTFFKFLYRIVAAGAEHLYNGLKWFFTQIF